MRRLFYVVALLLLALTGCSNSSNQDQSSQSTVDDQMTLARQMADQQFAEMRYEAEIRAHSATPPPAPPVKSTRQQPVPPAPAPAAMTRPNYDMPPMSDSSSIGMLQAPPSEAKPAFDWVSALTTLGFWLLLVAVVVPRLIKRLLRARKVEEFPSVPRPIRRKLYRILELSKALGYSPAQETLAKICSGTEAVFAKSEVHQVNEAEYETRLDVVIEAVILLAKCDNSAKTLPGTTALLKGLCDFYNRTVMRDADIIKRKENTLLEVKGQQLSENLLS